LLERAFREEWSRVLAHLVGVLGDLAAAEDACSEAFAAAAERWPRDGAPDDARAWLVVTARHRAIDRLRRERTLADKLARLERLEAPVAVDPEPVDDLTIPDERLELLFLCCHPALATDAQVALTLRALGGLSTEEIARAFLVAPEAMKRRLSRARAKIRVAGVPFTVPAAHVLPDRLPAVLAVIYLIFNEGYGGRRELAGEAVRLGRLLAGLMPDGPEPLGLLALMLLHDARSAARHAGGEVVLLADQDRSRWDRGRIREGRALLDRALARRGRGAYVLQAAIASLHVEEPVDWREVEALYRELVRVTGSAVAELNHAVAVAEAGDPARALAIADGLALPAYPYLHSTRAELLRRLGRPQDAGRAYRDALALTHRDGERRFLERRLASLTALHRPDGGDAR